MQIAREIFLKRRLTMASIWVALLLACAANGARCQQQTSAAREQTTGSQTSQVVLPRTMRVATRIVSPFVIQDPDRLTGFSIDLWDEIAAQLGVQTQYSVQQTVPDLLKAVQDNQADVAIAAVSVTADRDEKVDFSHPIFESGLQILVRDTSQKSGLSATLHSIFTPALFQLIGLMLLLILIPAHVVWFAERRHSTGMVEDRRYFPGIFHSAWWALSTLATQAEQMPKSPVGRVIAVIWMYTGIAFVAYFTATLTTQQTVAQLNGSIQSVSDLPGKVVATTAGSTSAAYLRKRGVRVREVPQIEQAYSLLDNGDVDAVVFDSPVLLYYASHEGKGKAHVVGSVFRKEDYAIVIHENSPYRHPINAALLRLRENGTYDELYERWFENK